MSLWPWPSKSRIEDLENKLDKILEELEENRASISSLEEDNKRIDQVVEDLQEELTDSDTTDLQPMEQEIFKVLMRSEEELSYKQIGEEMEESRTPAQVRPKLISLKEKVTILEEKQGRKKFFSIPGKTKTEYLEDPEIL